MVLLEFPCFFYDPAYVSNLISGSSAFSRSSLYIWKFLVHVVLKLSLKDFEHNLASIWNEHNFILVWTSLTLSFFGIRMKTDLFQSSSHCWVFKICWHIYCSTLIASCFRIWNSSAGKESACNEGDLGSIPRLGRSPGARDNYPPVFWPGDTMDYDRARHPGMWSQVGLRKHHYEQS